MLNKMDYELLIRRLSYISALSTTFSSDQLKKKIRETSSLLKEQNKDWKHWDRQEKKREKNRVRKWQQAHMACSDSLNEAIDLLSRVSSETSDDSCEEDGSFHEEVESFIEGIKYTVIDDD